MPSQFQSLSALIEAHRLSSGELWLALLSIEHPDMPTPLRLANPSRTVFASNGLDYQPSRFDLILSSEAFDQPIKASITIEAVDGVLLSSLQALDPSPTVDIRVVAESEPDIVHVRQSELIFSSLSVEGIRSMFFELSSEAIFGNVFPSKRMTRDRVPGIFTDV